MPDYRLLFLRENLLLESVEDFSEISTNLAILIINRHYLVDEGLEWKNSGRIMHWKIPRNMVQVMSNAFVRLAFECRIWCWNLWNKSTKLVILKPYDWYSKNLFAQIPSKHAVIFKQMGIWFIMDIIIFQKYLYDDVTPT